MTDLAVTGLDPFMSYGQSVTTVQGQYLSFKNAEWYYGQDAITLALGTKLLANMPGLRRGWKRWEGGKCTEERMDLVIDFVPATSRAALGDSDKALWELDNDGKPRDPWQEVSELQMMSPEGDMYIYSTGSFGGRNAIGALSVEYAKQYRQRPGQVPIVQLGAESYIHRQYGKLWKPVLTIVDWQGEDVLAIGSPSPEVVEEDDIPFDEPFKAGAAAIQEKRIADSLAANASAKPSGYDAVRAERAAEKAAALQASATPKPVKRARF